MLNRHNRCCYLGRTPRPHILRSRVRVAPGLGFGAEGWSGATGATGAVGHAAGRPIEKRGAGRAFGLLQARDRRWPDVRQRRAQLKNCTHGRFCRLES